LFQLYPLKQPLLSRHATEALAALCESQASHVSPATLAQILMVRAWRACVRGGCECVHGGPACIEGLRCARRAYNLMGNVHGGPQACMEGPHKGRSCVRDAGATRAPPHLCISSCNVHWLALLHHPSGSLTSVSPKYQASVHYQQDKSALASTRHQLD